MIFLISNIVKFGLCLWAFVIILLVLMKGLELFSKASGKKIEPPKWGLGILAMMVVVPTVLFFAFLFFRSFWIWDCASDSTMSYPQKFASFIQLCKDAKKNGIPGSVSCGSGFTSSFPRHRHLSALLYKGVTV